MKIRTPHAERCYEQINLFENTYRLFTCDFYQTDVIHYMNNIEYLKQLHAEGMFDQPGLLKDSVWNEEFNVRYDFNSIRGTHGECIIHVRRNQCGGYTMSRSCLSSKQNELWGRDGEIYNYGPNPWEGIYFQSKVLQYAKDDVIIPIYNSYLNPEYRAERLSLVNIERRTFMEMNLPKLRNDIVDDKDPKLVLNTYTQMVNGKPKTIHSIDKTYLMQRQGRYNFHEYG